MTDNTGGNQSDDMHPFRTMKAGDRTDFEAAVLAHYESVWRQHYLLCSDRDTSADLTQETFAEAWRSWPGFAGRSSPRTWLYTIAVRVWKRWLAKRPPPSAVEGIERLAQQDSSETPGKAAEDSARAETLACALRRLPTAQREVLVLCYRQEMSHSEAARALGVPVGTVKSRLHEGLVHLRRLLGHLEETL